MSARFGDSYIWVYRPCPHRVRELGAQLEKARDQGFRDCEDLILFWLERKADELDTAQVARVSKGAVVVARSPLASACRSAALAIRLGQHLTDGGSLIEPDDRSGEPDR